MQIRRVRNEEEALRCYIEQCWLPYHEELSNTVAPHSLVDDLDLEAVVEFFLDRLDSPSHRLWIAFDDAEDPTASLSSAGATFAGFVETELKPCPQHFDWADKLRISDLWVRDSYRGSGLADDLMTRVLQQAREDGCAELTIDVAVGNERALAYAETCGFEVRAFGMRVPLSDVTLDVSVPEPMSGRHASVTLRRLRVEADAIDTFVEKSWLPFWRDMGDAVGEELVSEDLDRDALVEEHLESYDVPDRRCWIALDGLEDVTVPLSETDAVFAGWLNAGLEPVDRFLDPPARLFIGNLYLRASYRGTGLADHLVLRAMQYAREEGCDELTLGVHSDNDRALEYYEKLGFEPDRQRMAAQLDAVDL